MSVLQRLALGSALFDCMRSCNTAAKQCRVLYHTTGTVIANTTFSQTHAVMQQKG
jgi:hypothetical protein